MLVRNIDIVIDWRMTFRSNYTCLYFNFEKIILIKLWNRLFEVENCWFLFYFFDLYLTIQNGGKVDAMMNGEGEREEKQNDAWFSTNDVFAPIIFVSSFFSLSSTSMIEK